MFRKLGFWGALASIVSLFFVFFPPSAVSQSTSGPKTVSSDSQSPATGENSENKYVLRNSQGGVTAVLTEPTLDAVGDPEKLVCLAIAGTPVELTGKTAKMGQIDSMWRQIKIVEGECANKVGWVTAGNVSRD